MTTFISLYVMIYINKQYYDKVSYELQVFSTKLIRLSLNKKQNLFIFLYFNFFCVRDYYILPKYLKQKKT